MAKWNLIHADFLDLNSTDEIKRFKDWLIDQSLKISVFDISNAWWIGFTKNSYKLKDMVNILKPVTWDKSLLIMTGNPKGTRLKSQWYYMGYSWRGLISHHDLEGFFEKLRNNINKEGNYLPFLNNKIDVFPSWTR